MITDSIKILSETSPDNFSKRMQAVADINAASSALETKLGLPHSLPSLNPARAKARFSLLQSKAAEKSIHPKPAAQAEAVPASPARQFESSGDATTDAAIKAAGCHSLAEYKASGRKNRLFATAVNLPAGSLARKCAEANLGKP